MPSLTTLANVKAWLAIQGADSDAVLTRLIVAASAGIIGYINRDVMQAAYAEVRDGTGGTRMMLRNTPVTAVSSVKVDGIAIAAAANRQSNGYFFDDVILYLRGYTFTRGCQNVEISYTAGYVDVPEELEQACIEWISLRYKERDRIGHQSKSIAGETVSYFIGDMPASVKTALKDWKRVAFP